MHPQLSVLPFRELRQNVLAGLVVATIALPLSIALAVAVGVPPIAGLYTAVFAGSIAAIFGGSRYNVTGPTAALVPVLNHAVLAHGVRALPILALLSGVFLLLLSLARAGRLVRYIPGTVVVGFTAGIALSIAFGQMNNLLGVTSTDPGLEHFHARAIDSLRHLGTVGPATPALAAFVLILLVAWPKLPYVRTVPGPLVAVVASAALTVGLDLDVATVGSQYGALPRDLPRPSVSFIDLDLIIDLLPLALSVAVLAGVESLLSAVVADGMAPGTRKHDPNQELRGQGLGNIAAAVFGGIPSTAAIARTAAGIRHGATSRVSSVVHSVSVLVATLALGAVVGEVPLAALAAILLVVAWNIAEVPEVVRLVSRSSPADALVVAGTAFITLFFDLTYAIAFGVFVSMAVLLVRLVSLPAAKELLPDEAGRIREVSPELGELVKARPDIVFFSAQGVLSFHTVRVFEHELLANDPRPLILRMKDVAHLDASGLLALESVIEHHQRTGRRIILTALQPSVRLAVLRFGILECLGPGNLFEHTRCAVADIDAHARELPGAEVGPGAVAPAEQLLTA